MKRWPLRLWPPSSQRGRVMKRWPLYLCARACREGWCVFDSSDYGLEIERDDERGVFETDDEAIAYVIGRALNTREALYVRALQVHADQCHCRAHDGYECPGGDCDGCRWECSTGRVRRALTALERKTP